MSTQPPEDNPEQMPPANASQGSGTPSRPLGRGPNSVPNTNWGRRTGGLGRAAPPEPPDLRRYSTIPRYDMATIADLIGVRAVTLWAWEQNLGVIAHDPAAEAATGLRYSERDLIVLSWLRDQIVAGVDPLAAAQKLRDAIVAAGGTPPPLPSVPRTPSRPLGSLTGRLIDPSLNPPSVPYPRQDANVAGQPHARPDVSANPPSMPYPPAADVAGSQQSVPYTRPAEPSMNPPSMPYTRPVVDPSLNPPSRPMWRGEMPMPTPGSQPVSRRLTTGEPSQPISRINASRHTPESVMPPSQPLPTGARPAYEGGQVVSQTWVGAMPSRDLRTLVTPLLQAFALFDSPSAARILDDAFMSRSVETTCLTLVVPAIARIHDQWARKDGLMAEGIFGMNMLKGRLFRLFDVLPENATAPLTIVATGPDEPHELNALMLALFWRRIGLRVVYLGAEDSGKGIVDSARKLRPRVVALTVTTAARARLVAQVDAEISKFQSQRPMFCLVGEILARDNALRKKMGGIFLGADAGEATQQVRQLLRAPESR